jgi:pre-mRNA-splicing factor CWC22
MARRYSSDESGSSDSEKRIRHKRDERRDERIRDDRDRERGNGKDLLDSDKRSRKQHERRDDRSGDDKDRDRANGKDVRDRDGRWRSEHIERRESRQSSAEDGELVERERGRPERERTHRHEDRHRRRETGDADKVKESHQSSDEDDRRVARGKRERERSHRHGHRHRQRDSEDGDRKKDRHRIDKEVNEQRKDGQNSGKNRDRDGKVLDGSKPQSQPKLQEGNVNADSSNLGKSGGVYIPPFKLARMMKEVEDKSSIEYQRLTWDALRKSINGLVNKVNAANIKNIIPELFSENLIRGRGLFCRSCMKSQMSSPGFTDVFAALVAVVNTKFPEVGDLLLRRIILQLKRAYKRNDKVCYADLLHLVSITVGPCGAFFTLISS